MYCFATGRLRYGAHSVFGCLDGATFLEDAEFPQETLLLLLPRCAVATGVPTQGPGATAPRQHYTEKLVPLFCGLFFKGIFGSIIYLCGTKRNMHLTNVLYSALFTDQNP